MRLSNTKTIQSLWIFVLCCSCNFFRPPSDLQSLKPDLAFQESGIDRFVSKNTLSGILSKEYYVVQADLPSDQSQVELFSHFRGFDLEDGVRVQLQRHKMDLMIYISVSGYPKRMLLTKNNYFVDSQTLDMTIAVENGTRYGFRVQVWENFINKTGVLKESKDILTAENLLVDSLFEGFTFYTKGQGVKWGLKLSYAHFIKGTRVGSRELPSEWD